PSRINLIVANRERNIASANLQLSQPTLLSRTVSPLVDSGDDGFPHNAFSSSEDLDDGAARTLRWHPPAVGWI
ncbi:MAG: hypothetical protein ABSD31_05175, partial [Candidatus Binataceae bacterium]